MRKTVSYMLIWSLMILLVACGKKSVEVPQTTAPPASTPTEAVTPAYIQVVPAEVLTRPGKPIQFRARAFDAKGSYLSDVSAVWSLNGLSGQIDGQGKLTPGTAAQVGTVSAQVSQLKGTARVRVIPPLPWSEDFESVELEKHPSHWIGATGKFFVRAKNGNKVLVKPPVSRGLDRSNVYIGPPNMKNYTIQADLMGTKNKRRRPDMGLIANRYTCDLMGIHQQLQLRSWASDLRMAKTIDFKWDMDVWYTMKMRVDIVDDKAIVKGKVWRTGEPEPEAWTITAEDPLPNREGSPGIYGYSAAEVYYDNLKVWQN
jgi:hypothetical protein